MVTDEPEGTDDAPIKPVSSLRSKFENLGQARGQSQSAAPTPRGLFSPNAQDVRNAPTVRASLDLPRADHGTSAATGLGITSNGGLNAVRSGSASRTRPQSLAQIPGRRLSPPRVTIISPTSPPKTADLRTGSRSPARTTYSSSLTSSGVSPKTIAEPIPQLPARPSVRDPGPSAENHSGADSPPRLGRSPRGGANGPPPVNRAGKPSLPGLMSGPSTPQLETQSTVSKSDKAISPFSTPPSSSESTPRESRSPERKDERRKSRQGLSTTAPRSSLAGLTSSEGPPPRRFEPPPPPFGRTPSLPTEDRRTFGSFSDGAGDSRMKSGHIPKPSLSGRSSPNKMHRIPATRRSQDEAADRVSSELLHAASNHGANSFPDRSRPDISLATRQAPPAIPAPRRSMDTRRSLDIRPSLEIDRKFDHDAASGPKAEDFDDMPSTGVEHGPSAYPDASQSNRRPPRYRVRPWELGTGYDTKLFTICGEYCCTGGYYTKVWNVRTGECIYSINHGEGVKITAMMWKPMKDVTEEGRRIWLGTNQGDIMELDVPMRQIVYTRPQAHPRAEISSIFRHGSTLWSMDNDGRIIKWKPHSEDAVASLDANPQTYRIPRGHSTSIVVGNTLWLATGKEVRVYSLAANSDAEFSPLQRPIVEDAIGDITCAAKISSQPNAVYFGHADGKVSVYNKKDYSLIGVFNVSVYKVSAMAGVGNYLWAGYNDGTIYVYDTNTTPWTVKKNWRAHSDALCVIIADQSSIWKLDRFHVVSLGLDNLLRIWDGMLEQDWLEQRMQERDEEYCVFDEITAAVMTWNAGASKPTALRIDQRDDNFFRDFFSAGLPPDLLVFGFQELVDLEDKKVTAKSFFKSKKKDSSDHDKMSHQYRAWRDHLVRTIGECMPPSYRYELLQTAHLVGLFSCVFVRAEIRPRIKQVNGSDIKRGMGGLHGNKGAIMLRMVIDDSSICLVNCHLAAGQGQTNHRNNDIAAILECENLAPCNAPTETFVGGGDGTMILDHEIVLLNGDLNYRIDAMTRDLVIKAVRDNDLTRLLERDQLLRSRARNPAFRLKIFQEMPITFAPTYKYNVGTDEYDTSEKKRSPAWCDRILFRGFGRVKCTEYRRWEVHTSDHRPVTARFKIRVKSVNPGRRDKVRQQTETELDAFRREVKYKVKLDYLVNVLSLDQKEAAQLLQR